MSASSLLDGESHTDDNYLEIFSLVWLDNDVDSVANQNTQKKLRPFLNYFKAFKNGDECQEYIEQRSKDDRIVLIVTGRFGREIVPSIHRFRQISSIYVYCIDKKANESWASKFFKIKNVIVGAAELITTIENDQKIQTRIDEPLSIHIFYKNAKKNSEQTKNNEQFVYFQLLIDCLLKMKYSQKDELELLALLKKEYEGNDIQMDLIRELEKEYLSAKIFWWYTRYSFFNRILYKPLHRQNIHMLLLLQSFLADLCHQLKEHQSNDRLKVFRALLLSNEELENLQKNCGQLVSIHSFFTGYTDRSKALADFDNLKAESDLQRVLFEIDADPKLVRTRPFALLSAQEQSADPSEVLFMAASTFSLTRITDNYDEPWIVKMTLCSDEEYRSMFSSMQVKPRNEKEPSNLRIFAKILWKMGKEDLAEAYYHRLIKELPIDDSLLMDVYNDLGTIAMEKKNYDASVQLYQKSVAIKKQKPPGSLTDSFPDTECTIQRPVCWKHDSCDQLEDEAHMRVYFHHLICPSGGRCELIDDPEHSKSCTHPAFCPDKGSCVNINESHLVQFRHVPICKDGPNCILLAKYDVSHRSTYRHCKVNCQLGFYCHHFHNNEHIEGENHPFKPPCPYTPYMCHFYDKRSTKTDQSIDLHTYDIHRFHYSHVCPRGRQCTERNNKEHNQNHIHVIRMECPDKEDCKLIDDQQHLNSYTHPSINDIRALCPHVRSDCPDRLNSEHRKRFRHTGHFDYIGVSRCLALNKTINFVQNQNDMIENIQKYVRSSNWNPTTITIPEDLRRWIRALQPIHRCNTLIFESILIHGHVMSRDHMNSLREPTSVAKAIKQHTQVKRILDGIENARFQSTFEEYILILVENHFNKTQTTADDAKAKQQMKSRLEQIEFVLRDYVKPKDMETVRKYTDEISEASLQLHSNPAGIGFAPDQDFGTNKHVFGVLGPHSGYYYGDILIVFRRELMYHPDSNFSIQAATTFGKTMNAYKWRPWLTDPGTPEARIEHFHRNKLHCSIPNYEDAAAHELIALTGLKNKSTVDVDLKAIIARWMRIDSHLAFEAHLPQLIPLDYIERVYMAQSTFDSLSSFAQKSSKTIFGDVLCITPHQINMSIKPAGLHEELDPTRVPYLAFVVKDVCENIEKKSNEPPLLQSTCVTLPYSQCKDQILVPLTISQSYAEYKSSLTSSADLSNTIYIYWEAFNGDMMLTLSSQIIDKSYTDQKDLQCLTCYIAKCPVNDLLKTSSQFKPDYREGYSYLGNHHPIKHYFVIDDRKFKSSSNSFHRGCNLDDYIMYSLVIDRNTRQVTLSIAGPNSIYNHQKISYTFDQTELDLNKLEFVQISAGAQTVPVRNLIIKYQPVEQFHPSIDVNFVKTITASPSLYKTVQPIEQPVETKPTVSPVETKPIVPPVETKSIVQPVETKPIPKKTSPPCPDSIHCQLQYAVSKEGKEHIEQYTHPCRFSEICLRISAEPHLIHIPHSVPMCPDDSKCAQLGEPLHRARFRHSKLPDYLVPCRYQEKCRMKAPEHKVKFFHGEKVPLPVLKENT